jgi:CheY-like chemotaxis protein
MDFSMPIMNGIDSTRAIRDHLSEQRLILRSKQPTIIGVTGHVQESFKKEGLNAGMDKVYGKPFYIHCLREVLKEYY